MLYKMSGKTKIAAIAAAASFLAGIVGVTSAVAQAPTPAPVPAGAPEKHPLIVRAIRMLTRTEADLRKADKDFGGHKEKAADLIHQAIAELHAAQQADKS